MKPYLFQCELWLPRPREVVFDFFADARNLQNITPPWLHFVILTPPPIEMRPGTLIDYKLRVHGLPLRWQTEITEWNPPHHFVDQQLRGPYKLWHHTHRFFDQDGGTRCVDEVRYLPPGGALINHLFVKRDVQKIFAYRQQQLQKHFGDGMKL
jgi:ligand-binding SRPBCC domain-containing protein